jgi:hypothetical protein
MHGNIGDTPQGRTLEAAASNTPAGQDLTIFVEIPDYAFTDNEIGLGMNSSQEGHAQLVPMLRDFAQQRLPTVA